MCNASFSDIIDFQELDSAFRYEITWLEQVFDSLQNYSTNDETACNGWAAHHASIKQGSKYPPGINTMSSLIRDKVATLKTQGHCMLENIKCTKIINPGPASFCLNKRITILLPQYVSEPLPFVWWTTY